MRRTALLNLLIVFSLLLPAATAPAAPPAPIFQEQVVGTTPTPIVTPTPTGSLEPAPYPTPFPTGEPVAYPTPLPAGEPTVSPTPTALPEQTAFPSAEAPTPSPTPEETFPARLSLRLELNLPQGSTPDDAPAQTYDPQTGKLELPSTPPKASCSCTARKTPPARSGRVGATIAPIYSPAWSIPAGAGAEPARR